MMGLPDGPKSFRIGLVVLIQYRLWRTPSQPPSHVAVAITLHAKASSLKIVDAFWWNFSRGWDVCPVQQQLIRFGADSDHDTIPWILKDLPLWERSYCKNFTWSALTWLRFAVSCLSVLETLKICPSPFTSKALIALFICLLYSPTLTWNIPVVFTLWLFHCSFSDQFLGSTP